MTLGRSKPCTKAQRRYQDDARALGCVVCLHLVANGHRLPSQCGHTTIHHRNRGDLHGAPRLGQNFVVSLGSWHHQGVILPGHTIDSMRDTFGPSFHHHAREFRTWTAEQLPGYPRGTEGWQRLQDELLDVAREVRGV